MTLPAPRDTNKTGRGFGFPAEVTFAPARKERLSDRANFHERTAAPVKHNSKNAANATTTAAMILLIFLIVLMFYPFREPRGVHGHIPNVVYGQILLKTARRNP